MVKNRPNSMNLLAIALASLVALSFVSNSARAAGPGFTSLSQDEFENAIREMSGNASYHSVTGAGTLGAIFGFEVGLVGGLTKTPEIATLSKRVDASADVSSLPHAALLLGASVPLGFTGELLLFPERTMSDVTYSQFGASVKWTATEALVLPFNLAIRGFTTTSKFSFQQTLNSAPATISSENRQVGFQLLASPILPIIEPYVGIGTVKANGSVAVTGTGTIFNYSASQTAESSPVSTQFLLGINANVLLLNLGLEYSRVFGTNSYNLKLGFRF